MGCVGVQRGRGWRQEEKRQQIRRGWGEGCVVPSPASNANDKMKAKGFVLWKLPVTRGRISATHSDSLGEATAGANILVCAKAYRRDSIMPELMSCTVFVLGVNEG